jgi:large subunit ribosomal protein L24
LGIAIILALVAALVGPQFVDWGQYRSVFEAEATRLVGFPVKITGDIDARILPTPSVVLHDIGTGADNARGRARALDIEFGLGALVRGELRAVNMRLVGPEVRVGLDGAGKIDWPAGIRGFDPDQLHIERLTIEDARAELTDRTSGSNVALEKFSFQGEVRSLAGPIKGEGAFDINGERYAYRIVAGRWGDDGASKLRLNLDPVDRALTIVADGTIQSEDGNLRFEGALTAARPVGSVTANGAGSVNVPWRLTSKVKATPARALAEQLEYQYGPEERGLKLTGTAELEFGKAPKLEAVLSARQVDLDRVLAPADVGQRLPVASIRSAIGALAPPISLPFPARVGIGIDVLTVAGGSLSALRGDFRIQGDLWDVESLEFRAPGLTQTRLSGRVRLGGDGAVFTGPAVLESSDPKNLIAWLEGRTRDTPIQIGALRVAGDITLGGTRIGIDRLAVDLDRKRIGGRLQYHWDGDGLPASLDCELSAAELDLDSLAAFARTAFANTKIDLPKDVALALDLGQTRVAGLDAKDIKAKLRFDGGGFAIERMVVADFGGAKFELSGQIAAPLTRPRGDLMLNLDATRLEGVVAITNQFWPEHESAIRRVARELAPLNAQTKLHIEPKSEDAGAAEIAKLTMNGTTRGLKFSLGAQANGEINAVGAADIQIDAGMNADRAPALLTLLHLDQVLALAQVPGTLRLTARGPLNGRMNVGARLAAGPLTIDGNGQVQLDARTGPTGDFDLSLAGADLKPMLESTGARLAQLPLTMKTRIAASRSEVRLDKLTGTLAGTPVRGELKVALGSVPGLDGRIDADDINVAALTPVLFGNPRAATHPTDGTIWSSEPFTAGAFDQFSGRIEFAAARALLIPGLSAQRVRGQLRFGKSEIAIEDVEGTVAGGRLLGQLDLQRVSDGVHARARLALTGVDAAEILATSKRMPFAGRLTVQLDAESTGLSPAALVGSLAGSGTITLEQGHIAGLEPRAFDAVIRSVDEGAVVDVAKIRDSVEAIFDAGQLTVPHTDSAFTISAGQVLLNNTVVRGDGGDAVISGRLDLGANTIDLRLTLSGDAETQGAAAESRPAIFIALRGTPETPKRTIDVSAFAGWLTLRAVDQQTKRLEAISREHPNATGGPGNQESAPPTAPPAISSPVGAPQPTQPAAPSPNVPLAPRSSEQSLPPLPPPVEIRPSPVPLSGANRASRAGSPSSGGNRNTGAAPTAPPAWQSRSVLDLLFGPQR